MKFYPKNIEELDNLIINVNPNNVFYRGHTKSTYELKPTISRNEENNFLILEKEKKILTEFRSSLILKNYRNELTDFSVSNNTYFNNWNDLIQAQHLEVNTRLLDWTTDFNIAKYFSTENNLDTTGSIWVYVCGENFIHRLFDENDNNIFNLNEHYILTFSSFFDSDSTINVAEKRRFRQSGVFMVFPTINLTDSFKLENNYQDRQLIEIVITPNLKQEIKTCLKNFTYYSKKNLYVDYQNQELKSEVERINSKTN